jgi:RimJ/RimL family protein N-acetyltransferase
MKLEGQFVSLRPLSPDDAAITLQWRLSPRSAFLQPGASTVAEQRSWIVAHQRDSEQNFIIQMGTQPVGMISLYDINLRNRNAELGRLLIGDAEASRGVPVFYETELLLCDYAFESLKLHKLYGHIMEGNDPMLRAMLCLGFNREGLLRDHYLVGDSFQSAVAVSLLDEEYWQSCRPMLVQMIR